MSNTKNILYMFSDYSCPWCYFGLNDFARLNHENDIKVVRKSFQILPDIPIEGISVKEYDAMKGNSPERRIRNNKITQTMVTKANLKWKPRTKMFQSRYAHVLGKYLIDKHNIYEEYSRLVFILEYAEGKNIAELTTLYEILDKLKIPKFDLEKVLNSTYYNNLVREDIYEAKQFNIYGAPAYQFNGKIITGYRTYSELVEFITQNYK